MTDTTIAGNVQGLIQNNSGTVNITYAAPPQPVKPQIPLLPYEPKTVCIAAGTFIMGSGEPNELPRQEVNLPDYYLAQYPTTQREYAEFIKQVPTQEVPKNAGWQLRRPPENKVDHPVISVSWEDAQAYCRWLSQMTGRVYRLPSEAEWEKAARGQDGRLYPWGNDWRADGCNCQSNDTTPVTAYPLGESPYHCYDMVGNVSEWTNTPLDEENYIHKGGTFRDEPSKLHGSYRAAAAPSSRFSRRGFRVLLEKE